MVVETSLAENAQFQSLPVSAPGARSRNVMVRKLGAAFAGVVGALLSVQVIERIGEVFVLPPDLASLGFGQVPPPEVQAKLAAAVFFNTVGNAAIWMGSVGAILGICFFTAIAISGGIAGSRLRMIIAVVSATAVFAAMAGVLGGWLDSIVRRNMSMGATSPSEQVVVLVHGIVWLVVGLGIGIGFTLGVRQQMRTRLESIVIIALFGMFGGCLFPIVAGVLLPAVNSGGSIPGLDPSEGRILWLNLPSVLMGLAVGWRHSGDKLCTRDSDV